MSNLIKKPSELVVKSTVKMLIYGQPGSGKSTVALSAPNPLLLDFDGGVQRVNAAFQCPTLQVNNWEEVQQVLSEDLSEYRTLVIDTAGKMLDYMTEYIIRKDSRMGMRDGSLQLKGYGVRKTMFINFLKQVSLLGKHIVFVAHDKEDKDGDKRFIRPEIRGSSSNDLVKELDLVGYLQIIGNDRTVCWNPAENYYAKNCCSLEPFSKLSVVLDAFGGKIANNDFLTKVFERYDQYLNQQKQIGIDYKSLLDKGRSIVEQTKDVDTFNNALKELSALNVIWDSKLQINEFVKAKAKELNLVYNKESKKYEAAV